MIRVQIISAKGSTPRETGAEMMVGANSTSGTIGGGQLEYMAIDRARQMLQSGEPEAQMNIPLGPEIGQCCGGRVMLHLDRQPATPETRPDVLIFGAGHVGRALAQTLHHLPFNTTLIDQRPEELAQADHLNTKLTPFPEAEIRAAKPGTAILILTHDHALDFLLAAEALSRLDLPYIGMIGSTTKRAQFTRYACQNDLDPTRLICPIGANPTGDKRPAIIAAFTATELITTLISSSQKYPCDS